jgi:hypothetical protein
MVRRTDLQKAMVMGETRRETAAEAAPNQPATDDIVFTTGHHNYLMFPGWPEASLKYYIHITLKQTRKDYIAPQGEV